MPSFLELRGYVFDTEALKDAYLALPPAARSSTTGYDEGALRVLLRYFADWGPVREDSLRLSPTEELEQLSSEEKRELYNEFTKRLSENLAEQYSRDVDQHALEGFLHRITDDPVPESLATFFLRDLWQMSKRLHAYEQDLLSSEVEAAESETVGTDGPNVSEFALAIHRLPGVFLDQKQAQYRGDNKINGIRYRALETIRSEDSLTVEKLQAYQQEENEKHESNIMQAYDEFTVLGQLYYDYFKPRIDAYLSAITTYLVEELDIAESSTHQVNFAQPRNRLNDSTWFAIYPTEAGNKADAYQLFTEIRWDGVRYGLYAGDNLREEEWEDTIDIDNITEIDALTIELLAEKFDSVLQEYYRVNDVKTIEPPAKPPDDLAETVARQLQAEKQVVFYGPPGTGKTFEAQRFADWWVYDQTDGQPREGQVQSVTFHPSFSYEDFIEGLTAEATDDGDVEYRIEPGILKRVAENARQAYDQADGSNAPPYVLIIDEINRGNLAQIFGETITLLEHDKRGTYSVSLAHSDESFTLPPNLYVIGTMNTADRSIALVDAALRRRFRFLPFPPKFDVIAEHYGLPQETDPLRAYAQETDSRFEALLGLSILVLERINANITQAPDLSKGQQIGHSYLYGLGNTEAVVDAWKYDILPLLEEYYFGQFDRIQRHLFDVPGEGIIDWEGERVRDFDAADLGSFLAAFLNLDVDYETKSTEGSQSATSGTTTETPHFPDFLQSVGSEIVDEVSDQLQVNSLDEAHRSDHYDRLSLGLVSQHSDHPGRDAVQYRLQPRVHKENGLRIGLIVDDPVRNQIDIEALLKENDLDDAFEYDDLKYWTVEQNWPVQVEDPDEIDGEELRSAIGEDTVETAVGQFIDLIRTMHPEFVATDFDLSDEYE